MDIGIFAINLDRSADRWDTLSLRARELGLTVIRVSGVDGTKTLPEDRVDCDVLAFKRNNGRTMLPGEYGCYQSHLKVLAAFLETEMDVAVVVEDDIELGADLLARAHAAVEAVPTADVIKLFNHRVVGFRPTATSGLGDEIGRAAHGPLGSSACYVVTRAGAERLRRSLRVMEYPLDIALERGWAYDAQIYTTRVNVAAPKPDGSTIATRAIYKTTKFPWWKRLATYRTRITESLRRVAYSRRG